MKKILFACLMLAGTQLHAQRVTGGLKAGLNISNFTGGDFDDVDKKSLVGFHAGGFLNINLVGGLSVQPEALVSTAGAKIDAGAGDRSYRLTYLTVPVMLKFKPAGGFYFELGPQVGFKLGEDVADQTIDHFAKDLDLAAGAGLGYQVGGIGVGARYLVGLSKVGDFDASNADPDFHNSTIQVGISFRL